MKAGKTDLEVNTLVRITYITDPDDQNPIGVEGKITHPFNGLMSGSSSKYVASLWVTEESAAKCGLGSDGLGITKLNLCRGDKFEVIDLTDDLDAEASGPNP
jgi:hypothetical protein